MSENYAFSEGSLYIWTGAATASGSVIALVQNVSLQPNIQWQSFQNLTGGYYQHNAGQNVNVNAGISYTDETYLLKLFALKTAVHAKIEHSSLVNGTAGYILYSGRLSLFGLDGSQGGVMNRALSYVGHEWTGY